MNNDTNLNIIVSLKDQATKDFKKVADDLTNTGNTMSSKLGGAIGSVSKSFLQLGTIVGGAAVAFGVSSVKAFEDAEVAMARVDAVLKTMGKSAIANKDAILKAADAAVRLGFDDEDAAESITRFYQATGNLTQATKLNAIAMDLARAKHLDLSTAAGLVNQVLSGNGRVLKQYQINLKDSATPLEALGELQEKVAGQASAFTGTFQGQMAVLDVGFNNLKESIGETLASALIPFVTQLNTWLQDPTVKENLLVIVKGFLEMAGTITKYLIIAWQGAVDVMTEVFVIVIKIIDGIDKAIAKVIQLGQTISNNVGGAFKNAGSNIMWALNGAVPGRAVGGPVTAGSPYMVGENGPELFMPSNSGTIIPNGKVGGGGTMINLSFSGSFFGTDRQTAERFGNMIAKTLEQQIKLRAI